MEALSAHFRLSSINDPRARFGAGSGLPLPIGRGGTRPETVPGALLGPIGIDFDAGECPPPADGMGADGMGGAGWDRPRTELEQRLIRRTAELEVAKARAEAADKTKSAFLASMSHELRTPLNAILGFTGIVLNGMSGPLTPEQSEQLGMVRESARHLLSLVNEVLDLSKIEAGKVAVHAKPFDVVESVGKVVRLLQPLADQKGLALTVVSPVRLEPMVSDQRRIEQILLNLVNNALKFTRHGKVTVTLDTLNARRCSGMAAPRRCVRFRVADTGVGIKREDLATLFQPFRQVDDGRIPPQEGTGLGLAISRKLAGLLGGEISASSDGLKGSEFTVIVPIDMPSAT
jgi:signal transduction histidine kinase